MDLPFDALTELVVGSKEGSERAHLDDDSRTDDAARASQRLCKKESMLRVPVHRSDDSTWSSFDSRGIDA